MNPIEKAPYPSVQEYPFLSCTVLLSLGRLLPASLATVFSKEDTASLPLSSSGLLSLQVCCQFSDSAELGSLSEAEFKYSTKKNYRKNGGCKGLRLRTHCTVRLVSLVMVLTAQK